MVMKRGDDGLTREERREKFLAAATHEMLPKEQRREFKPTEEMLSAVNAKIHVVNARNELKLALRMLPKRPSRSLAMAVGEDIDNIIRTLDEIADHLDEVTGPSVKEYQGRKAGDKVIAKYRAEGWFPGTIVRLIDREADSPLYVVDIGRYESIIVTPAEIRGQ